MSDKLVKFSRRFMERTQEPGFKDRDLEALLSSHMDPMKFLGKYVFGYGWVPTRTSIGFPNKLTRTWLESKGEMLNNHLPVYRVKPTIRTSEFWGRDWQDYCTENMDPETRTTEGWTPEEYFPIFREFLRETEV